MLIRATTDSSYECILQEHHAVLSGLLAAAWQPSRLDPLLIQAVGLHDNPWRNADANLVFDEERGLPHDFVSYPMEQKIIFYRRGIDELEDVHPWIAHLVSRHYTTFSGTRDEELLQRPEQARRERLEAQLTDRRRQQSDEALKWVKFFDIFSLHLCLTGPHADSEAVPRWLRDPSSWTQAPDGTDLELEWLDDTTLAVDPWPFAPTELPLELYHRRLAGTADDADALQALWNDAPMEVRALTLRAR